MNPVWGNVAGGIIVAMMLVFISIWIWSWNARHKPAFDALARMPMDDTDEDLAKESP